MKIAIIITDITNLGGTETATFNLIREFSKLGYDTEILSLFHENTYLGKYADKIKYITNLKYIISNGKARRIKNLFKMIVSFNNFLKTYNADLFICQAFLPAFALYLCGLSDKGIVCEHFKYDLYGGFMTIIRNRIYRNFKKIVTLTDEARNSFKKVGIETVTIPNMIEGQAVEHIDNKRMITAGRFVQEKGYDLLIKALTTVKLKHPDWILDIYGEGELEEELKNLAVSYDVYDIIRFKGKTNQLRKEMAQSSLFILSSRHEGLPMVMLEAMSVGLPIISFACAPGPINLLKEDCGLLIEAGNTEKLGMGICQLIESPKLRQIYSENSLNRIKKYYPDAVMTKWEILIQDLQV